jgi:hypothetical protein
MEEPLESHEMPPVPKMPLGKVALANFVILLLMLALCASMNGEELLISLALLILLQTAVNFIIGLAFQFSPKMQKVGQAMLICSVLVPLIGFGLCIITVD